MRFTGTPPPKHNSAVLVPLFERNGQAYVVLTTRSIQLKSHTGEVSFPGGRQEPGEPLTTTALRETEEEIGLSRERVTLVGELDRLATVSSKSSIHPFVGRIDELPALEPSPAEVERVLLVPIAELIEPGVYREERWTSGVYGHERAVHFFELVGDTVWGATAAMLHQLLDLVIVG
ncbi:MAG: CoA pyrophosphatase [Actinomycetia bacterium]|nr:CoA pyrophosphatase [Actinomycetes bacterium]MCP4963186.1 CoA pyrophosphatase [Actinomycetes bacterium]